MKEEYFTTNFENYSNISGKLFYADRHTDRGTEIIKLAVEFRNYGTPLEMAEYLQKICKFLAFLQIVEPISHYYLSGQHSYTRGPLADTNALSSESSGFKYHADG